MRRRVCVYSGMLTHWELHKTCTRFASVDIVRRCVGRSGFGRSIRGWDLAILGVKIGKSWISTVTWSKYCDTKVTPMWFPDTSKQRRPVFVNVTSALDRSQSEAVPSYLPYGSDCANLTNRYAGFHAVAYTWSCSFVCFISIMYYARSTLCFFHMMYSSAVCM